MKRNVKSEDSTLLQVFAWGSTDQEARSFAMMKLLNLFELLREILCRWQKTKDMKLLVSEIIGDTHRPSFLDANCKEALDVGVQLFSFYSHQIHGTWMKDRDWHSVSVAIKECFEKCTAKLQPLLKYYLVPLLPSLLNKCRHILLFEKRNLSKHINPLFFWKKKTHHPSFQT